MEIQEGEWKIFHENGQLSSEGKYVNGKRKANGNPTVIMGLCGMKINM